MTISKTPFRISFVGGGTDFRDYYQKSGGEVISTTIKKYIYVIVSKSFHNDIRLHYHNEYERCRTAEQVEHDIIRECMKMTGVDNVEISIVSEIPSGSGLGSSSTLTVGLLNALYAYKGSMPSRYTLAEKACEIEIDILKKPNGKQDQYAAAYGGLNHIEFNPDDTVKINLIPVTFDFKDKIEKRCMLFYTGYSRESASVLAEQNKNTVRNYQILDEMRDFVDDFGACIRNQELKYIGKILYESWQLKKKLASNISNTRIDNYCDIAMNNGATGLKINGAGNGGFLLVYAEPEYQEAIRNALRLKEIPFKIEPIGSTIIDL